MAMTEKSSEQKSFEILLQGAGADVQERYLEYLEQARREGEQKTKSGHYFVPYSEREELLKQAAVSAFHKVDVRSMRRAWENAGGDENPPIGGSQSD